MKPHLTKLKQSRTVLKKQITELTKDLVDLESNIKVLKDSISLAKDCIEQASSNRIFIQEGVTQGLQLIFEEEFIFRFDSIYDGENLKGIKPVLKKGPLESSQIEEVFGNGVRAMTDCLLYIFTMAIQPTTRKFLVLDEVPGLIGEEIWERFVTWVEPVCEALDLQLVLLTHHLSHVGKVYLVEQVDGVSSLELMK